MDSTIMYGECVAHTYIVKYTERVVGVGNSRAHFPNYQCNRMEIFEFEENDEITRMETRGVRNNIKFG